MPVYFGQVTWLSLFQKYCIHTFDQTSSILSLQKISSLSIGGGKNVKGNFRSYKHLVKKIHYCPGICLSSPGGVNVCLGVLLVPTGYHSLIWVAIN